MAKFDRQVERQKKNFTFTKKEEEKKQSLLKKAITFDWIPRKWTSFLIIILNFIFVTFVGIPLLLTRFDANIAMLLGHGIITSLLIVLSFYHLENRTKKIGFTELILRYITMVVIMLAFSTVSILVI